MSDSREAFEKVGNRTVNQVENFRKELEWFWCQGWSARDAETLNEWREAVIDALVVGHIYQEKHKDNPKQAIADLIEWENTIALDPRVSKEAQTLVDKGREEAMDTAPTIRALKARVEELEAEAKNEEKRIKHMLGEQR